MCAYNNHAYYRALLSKLKTPLDVQHALMRHAEISTPVKYDESTMSNRRIANTKVVREILTRRSSQ